MKKLLLSTTLLSLLSGSVIAASAFTEAEDAVSYRQHSFQLIRHNMADVKDMLTGAVPFEASRLQKRADALATLTTLPWEAFTVPGADKASKDAKAEIWQNLQDFQSRGEQLAKDAKSLQSAAQTQDQTKVKAAFAAFAKNCKACHDKYKAD
ncbi:c-type cytochrome [Rheinheimera sp. 4Y26]|uniref:c-type cytochrome n=1 Tax=Rheinheimera sp. 4Y26 TaxID=2977811 RepID=UPI0021B0B310|nr:cytochrome c [Rheinheimera sp. 4Y26]MCT6701330.1 cytochrome c [Rheinheimera sp. 4Y26]